MPKLTIIRLAIKLLLVSQRAEMSFTMSRLPKFPVTACALSSRPPNSRASFCCRGFLRIDHHLSSTSVTVRESRYGGGVDLYSSSYFCKITSKLRPRRRFQFSCQHNVPLTDYPTREATSAFRTFMIDNSIDSLPDMAGWALPQAMATSISFLAEANVDEPEASVTNLLAHALQLPWESGFRQIQHILDSSLSTSRTSECFDHHKLSLEESMKFRSYILRRLNHEPIQYIVGQWDFMDSVFLVQPPLLCPRPETEELVYHILEDLAVWNLPKIQQQRMQTEHYCNQSPPPLLRILDVGCGTGVIGISLAKELHKRNISVSVDAIDIDPVAVEVSRINAERILPTLRAAPLATTPPTPAQPFVTYKVHLAAAQEFFLPNEGHKEKDSLAYDLVVSNPPYIPPRDMNDLSPTVRQWEHPKALCGGISEDGMDIIRVILSRLPQWCCSGHDLDDFVPTNVGLPVCWMEVDPSQPSLIEAWLTSKPLLYNTNDSCMIDGTSLSISLPKSDAEPPLPSGQCGHQMVKMDLEKSVNDMSERPRFIKIRVKKIV